MKGILKKTEEGWFVVFDQRTLQDPSAEDGILPLHPTDVEMIDEDSKVFDHIESRIRAYPEVEFEVNMYDGKSHISNAWNGYAKLVATDENGKPLTYWGGLKDRTCDHTNCREVCPECKPYHVSEDCEEVKNWDSFVEQKNKELEIESLAEISSELQEATYTTPHKTTYKHGFIDGYNKAKELFKEELAKAYTDGKTNGIGISHPLSIIKEISFDSWYNDNYESKHDEGTSQPSNF